MGYKTKWDDSSEEFLSSGMPKTGRIIEMIK
jgi:hypothetical protein